MYEENYQLLADAVIMQAVQDYRNSESQTVRDEVKRFFLYEIFCIFSPIDGKRLLKKSGVYPKTPFIRLLAANSL